MDSLKVIHASLAGEHHLHREYSIHAGGVLLGLVHINRMYVAKPIGQHPRANASCLVEDNTQDQAEIARPINTR